MWARTDYLNVPGFSYPIWAESQKGEMFFRKELCTTRWNGLSRRKSLSRPNPIFIDFLIICAWHLARLVGSEEHTERREIERKLGFCYDVMMTDVRKSFETPCCDWTWTPTRLGFKTDSVLCALDFTHSLFSVFVNFNLYLFLSVVRVALPLINGSLSTIARDEGVVLTFC